MVILVRELIVRCALDSVALIASRVVPETLRGLLVASALGARMGTALAGTGIVVEVSVLLAQ